MNKAPDGRNARDARKKCMVCGLLATTLSICKYYGLSSARNYLSLMPLISHLESALRRFQICGFKNNRICKMAYGTSKVSTLNSAERILDSVFAGKSVPITLNRESEKGVIFMTCDALPELFLAVTSDDEIRSAIDRGLRNAFCKDGRDVSVYTNGSISGPKIGAMVRVVPAD